MIGAKAKKFRFTESCRQVKDSSRVFTELTLEWLTESFLQVGRTEASPLQEATYFKSQMLLTYVREG